MSVEVLSIQITLKSILGLHSVAPMIIPPHRANARNANASNASTVSSVSDHEAKVPTNTTGGSVATRVRDFVRMNSPKFLGSKVGEDPQNFIDEAKMIFEVIQMIGTESVELAFYQLKNVAHIWFTQWKENRGADAAYVTWDCFTRAFMDRLKDKSLGKCLRTIRRLEHDIMNTLSKVRVVEIAHSFSTGLQPQHIPQLALRPPGFDTIRKVGNQVLSHRGVRDWCFGYGQSGHRLKQCPSSRQGQGGNNNRAQSTAPVGGSTQQGVSFCTGGCQRQKKLYALQSRQDKENSPDVVTRTFESFI
ncbi:uncharacterized protein LOC125824752 [Solanum verrucosum]|uniref:uncharacterized protein LOC125824752 n=1 Tax=Solanum verrucosum TaxID=315347 RepID=UPI0020CFF232|nr:uncharacterized protein LOC125824752 [Solanum verrucosum]